VHHDGQTRSHLESLAVAYELRRGSIVRSCRLCSVLVRGLHVGSEQLAREEAPQCLVTRRGSESMFTMAAVNAECRQVGMQ